MTLFRGDHLVKLGADGKPLTTTEEIYIEYIIVKISNYYPSLSEPNDILVDVTLKKVR